MPPGPSDPATRARRLSRRPILCAVLDADALGPKPDDAARTLFASGVDWIQLRDRTLPDGALLELTQILVAARDAAQDSGREGAEADFETRVIVNRRVDVAVAAGADGVHLGFDAIEVAEARRRLPVDALIGRSLHAVSEIEEARDLREHTHGYGHLAPIWDPNSKAATRPALGPDILSEATRFGLPILAQGGVDPERAVRAIGSGAAGVAVTGIFARGRNPMDMARQLRSALDRPHDAKPPGGARAS